MLYFSLDNTGVLGPAIAAQMAVPVAPHEFRAFADGEHKLRPMVSVRGEDVFIFSSLHSTPGFTVNDRLIQLLFFIAACRENGAHQVTALVPCLPYSRKDRQTKPRDPVTSRYVAQLFEAVGLDRIVTLDVHNLAAFQNAFRCATVHLDTRRLFADDLAIRAGNDPVVVLSPDSGGVKRARSLKLSFESKTERSAGFAIMEKHRSRGVVSGDLFAGDVEGAVVAIVDDMIVSGGTLLRAARACRERGAHRIFAYATHGLFTPSAAAIVGHAAFDGFVVTDTAAPFDLPSDLMRSRIDIISVAPLLGEAVSRLDTGQSIQRLLGEEE